MLPQAVLAGIANEYCMPTPFMHLQMAEAIGIHADLHPDARDLLAAHRSEFYLGSVAPDVQTVSRVPRVQTHFYDLPPETDDKAYPKMLARYPRLNSKSLPPNKAVFVSAYCAHLMLDLRWYYEVLIPYFIDPPSWDDNHQRFVVHNTLLTFLDKSAANSLPSDVAQVLDSIDEGGWLPFVENEDLMKWRDILVDQLRPGAPLRTIEIYASRLYMSPEEFAANLNQPAWMDEHLFRRVPVPAVKEMLASAVPESVKLINDYLIK